MISSIAFIGYGKAAKALLHLIKVKQAARIDAIWSKGFSKLLPTKEESFVKSLDELIKKTKRLNTKLIIIAVPDDQISLVIQLLPTNIPLIHLSGALGFEPFINKGLSGYGFFHLSASLNEEIKIIKGTTVAINGSSQKIVDQLFLLANKLALSPFVLNEQSSNRYHAACTLASSLTYVPISIAHHLLSEGGLQESDIKKILSSLVSSVAKNIKTRSIASSLTGPILRNDQKTIKKHLAVISDPELVKIYLMLSEKLKKMAE